MSHEMNGAEKLEEQLNQLLDQYDEKLRLGINVSPIDSMSKYCSLSQDELDKMAPETCQEISLELIQYSIFLQRELNRERARLNWCESYIYSIASKYWEDYDKYLKAEIKIPMIAKENPVLNSLLELKAKLSSMIMGLDHIPTIVKGYADKFENYARIKRWTSTN